MKKFFEKYVAMLNIKNNFAMKILSLVLAILFWIFVMDTENPIVTRTFYNIPVVYVGEPDSGLVVSSAPNYYSNIEISGRRNSVLATRTDSFVLKVHLAGLKDGKNEAVIEYTAPSNDIHIDRVSPSNVVITMEKVITVEKPVYYNKISSFEESLSGSEITIDPTTMSITGPRSLVADVSSLIANIDVSEIKESGQVEIPLIPVNSLGEKVEGITFERESALLTIRAIREKTVPFTYEYRDETDERHRLIRFIVSKNTVSIVGDPEDVDRVTSLKANPIVITGKDDATGNIEFEKIEGITILRPDQIHYQAEFVEIMERDLQFTAKDFQMKDIGDGLIATVDESAATLIRIKGTENAVNQVSPGDFRLTLDAKNLEEGEHYILPKAEYLSATDIQFQILAETPIKVVITKKTEE